MDKLVITVTVDSSMSFPNCPYCPDPKDVDRVAEEYVQCVKAGASMVHMHGVHKLEDEIQPDGRKLSRIDFEGWKRMKGLIEAEVKPVFQFGIASARLPEKIKLMSLHPDLMSYCFTSHDENFAPDPTFPENDIYATHPRAELVEFCKIADDHGVKVEVESFSTGAYYDMRYVAKRAPLPGPIWTTLFLGWPGGQWTPPTPQGLVFMVENLPQMKVGLNWNVSCMDVDQHWQVLTQAINMGGHVRVGWEDNPYVTPGVFAKHSHELVDKIVRISHEMGREVATPEEARKIIFGKK